MENLIILVKKGSKLEVEIHSMFSSVVAFQVFGSK